MAVLLRHGQWNSAIKLASSPYSERDDSYLINSYLTLSRCYLELGKQQLALHWAQQVIQALPFDTAKRIDQPASPQAHQIYPAHQAHWFYAHLLAARAYLALGDTDAAISLLTSAYKRSQTNPQINKQLALSLIDRYGDWSAASKLFKQANAAATMPQSYACWVIQSHLYNGIAAPEALTQSIVRYSQHHLCSRPAAQPSPEFESMATCGTRPPGRKRLGLASPLWCASPMYFLCVGALRHLAQDFDLVFFHTGKRQDWATEELRSLSSDWHEASGLSASALTQLMRRSQLHVLLDMGGWLDTTLLRAMAQRPVQRQYKWVGGQSATTGLNVFDGFITDCHQTPADAVALYSEPLAVIPGGYVTYTPPPYMPAVRTDTHGEAHSNTLEAGIVSHPKKLSAGFLRYLRGQIQAYAGASTQPINLCFVGWRYGDALLQQRINQALGLDAQARHGPVNIHYRGGNSHAQQLQLVSALDWVVDTFPYTAGVTALEALALGVPLRTHVGPHFSQRHGYSHARFAGMCPQDILLSNLGALGSPTRRHHGHTLLAPDCARLNHVALAQSLSHLFSGHPPTGAVPA
ncbi:MAG: hypothetical protein KA045_00065 [Burkholderiaceae bacterium]|nr:hypothetical protein [Burkholderiaceae bacterium]